MSASPPAGQPVVTPAHLERLAVFPLQGVTLFPHAVMPLHIFEPRYRDMIGDALAAHAPICVVGIDESHGATTPPAVHSIGTVGVIIHHDALPDGRYNVLLRGVSRVLLASEHRTDKRYRQFRASLLHEVEVDPALCGALHQSLRSLVRTLATTNKHIGPSFARLAATDAPAGAWCDLLADAVIRDADVRQHLLAELRVDARLELLLGRASDLLARFASMQTGTPRN